MRWFLSVAVAGLVAASASIAAPASPKRACLRWADIDTLTRNGPDTVLARSRRRGNYEIRFTGHCDYQRSPMNYFIVRLHDRWECVDSLHVLDVNEAGACFIESVTPIR